MAKQFSKSNSRVQRNLAMANVPLDETIIAQPDTVQIASWLSRLHLLYGIPFNYLVPDIRMLPDESIRFFQVDANWITALIDGAYSLGTTMATSTVSQVMQTQVQAQVNQNLSAVRAGMLGVEPEQAGPANLSGFFLRSAAVSGWPGMEVTGYADEAGENPLKILRMERISPSLLLCLFNGILARVEMSEPTETLHFDFEFNSVRYSDIGGITDDYYTKRIRYVNTEGDVVAGSFTNTSASVTVLANKVVKISSLADAMARTAWAPGTPTEEQEFTSAEFALTMVQNTDFASFQINSQND
jgi:hypothetical protein